MSQSRDGIFMGGIGSDVFGEHTTGRNFRQDSVNDFLRDKYLREYLNWHRANARFYEGFESDLAYVKFCWYQKWGMALGAAAFAAVVINPNFTKRRSYYGRKLIPFMFGLVTYQYGYRNENVHMTNLLLKMNDYLPLEVRRTMQTKDYRHIACFDYRNPGRQLFDEQTGKSLS